MAKFGSKARAERIAPVANHTTPMNPDAGFFVTVGGGGNYAMRCTNCGSHSDQHERFCRKCGADLSGAGNRSDEPPGRGALQREEPKVQLVQRTEKDPDELIGRGLASIFIGDGFFMVGILLSVMESSVTSLLWLLLLIPAFAFFGKGVSDVFQAKQIRRRKKQNELKPAPATQPSGNLFAAPSVTERTTRQLK